MNKKSFGLDIGVSSIKAVELDADKNNFKLKACIVVPSPPKGMLSESPVDEEEMAEALKKAVYDAGISVKKTNIALPENQVYTKVVEMPYLSDRELASAIYWEAEQYIPIPLSSVSLSWNVIRRSQKPQPNEKMEVLMVGAPTLIIKKYQKVIGMAGLGVSAMETEIISTVRAITAFNPVNYTAPTIIVNIGAISTSLAIVSGNNLIFTYSLPIGGAAINRAISADFGLSTLQAEEYKKTYGIAKGPLGARIGKATEPIISSILSEVKKAIIYFSQKYKDSRIEQIILSGESARLPGIDIYFANSTGIETVIANPWKFLNPSEVPKEILDRAPDYSIAVGLALRDYEH
ncbi:MAG: type IV pilus assembly protein PilM [Candidatus Levybacteria bacterium]|nr:type IV pilus assembly protein PilM [Candidatus Levybacteria bacterium]